MILLGTTLRIALIVLSIATCFSIASVDATTSILLKTETIEIGTKLTVKSKYLEQERELLISLPKNYLTSNSSYPVLYVLDGAPFFSSVATISTDLAMSHAMENSIVVAISQINRREELAGAKKDVFSQYINNEVIPHINQHYRTGSFKVLIGHSLGGSFALNAFISKADVFNAYLIVSPVLNGNNVPSTEEISTFLQQNKNIKNFLYLAKGNEIGEYQLSLDKLISHLQEKAPESLLWSYQNFPDDSHETVPFPAFHYGLKKLYEGWIMPEISDLSAFNSIEKLKAVGGVEGISHYYEQYSTRLGYSTPMPSIVFSRLVWMLFNDNQDAELKNLVENDGNGQSEVLYYLGYRYIDNKKYHEAVNIFKLDVGFHPQVARSWHSLAESYILTKQLVLAENSFVEAIRLAKNNRDPQLEEYQKSYDDFIIDREKL